MLSVADLYRVDLLRERRAELGLQSPSHVNSSLLLRRGVLSASLPLALTLFLLGFVGIRLWSVSLSADQLNDDHARHELLSSRLQNRRASIKQLEASNLELVDQLLTLPVSSVLLAELSLLTPAGLRLLSIQEKEGSLTIKGSAIEPLAFARIESFMISLASSILFDGNSIQLTKADLVKRKSNVQDSSQADPLRSNSWLASQGKIPVGGGQGAAMQPEKTASVRDLRPILSQPLAFELKASLANISPKELVSDLIQLGAKGVAIRARELEYLGLLK